MKSIWSLIVAISLTAAISHAAELPKSDRARLDQVQQNSALNVPRVLCLDDDFATGAQPGGDAYTKAAANGFRSVVSLRTANEGLDLARERTKVEMRQDAFLNIPVISSAPEEQQADDFPPPGAR